MTQAQAVGLALPNPTPDVHVVSTELTTVGGATTEVGGARVASLLIGDDVPVWLIKLHFDVPADLAATYGPQGVAPHPTNHLYVAIDATDGVILSTGGGAAGLSW